MYERVFCKLIMGQIEKKVLYHYSNTPMFSIIMPIYNGETYLDNAITSVIIQTEQSWELILINDGSTDSSLEICKKYVSIDKRVRLLEKRNSGVSDSRNKGLEMARGEWILFLDADDWFETKFLYELKKRIMDSSFDFYICNYYDAIDEKQKNSAKKSTFEKIDKVVFGKMADVILRQTQGEKIEYYGNLRVVWAKCFKREYIKRNHIQFCPQLKIGEDMLFVLEYIKYVESIYYINCPLYNYRDNPFSVMRSRKWSGIGQGKLYFSKVEEVVGNIVEESAKADLWLETAEEDWRVLHVSNLNLIRKVMIFREIMQDELYIRFSHKNAYMYSSKKQKLYTWLIRNQMAFGLMLLSYCRIQKHKVKYQIKKLRHMHNS